MVTLKTLSNVLSLSLLYPLSLDPSRSGEDNATGSTGLAGPGPGSQRMSKVPPAGESGPRAGCPLRLSCGFTSFVPEVSTAGVLPSIHGGEMLALSPTPPDPKPAAAACSFVG